jgi:cytochrome c5
MKPFCKLTEILFLILLPIACATALPVPTEETAAQADRDWPGTTLTDLQSGRRCYIETCAACHNLHLPSEYSPEKWTVIMEKMQVKARISDNKEDLILHYLMVTSQDLSK